MSYVRLHYLLMLFNYLHLSLSPRAAEILKTSIVIIIIITIVIWSEYKFSDNQNRCTVTSSQFSVLQFTNMAARTALSL